MSLSRERAAGCYRLKESDAPTVNAKLLVHRDVGVSEERIALDPTAGDVWYPCGYLMGYIQSLTSARRLIRPPPGTHRMPALHGNAKRVPNLNPPTSAPLPFVTSPRPRPVIGI